MLKEIIFDYDGVLADSDSFTQNAWKHAFKERALEFNHSIYKKYFAGKTLADGLKSYLKTLNKLELFGYLKDQKISYDKYYPRDVVAYKDTLDFILKHKGMYGFAIASGSRRIHIDSFLQKFKLQGIFNSILTAEDYNKGKPNPECYLLILKALNISPQEAIAVEDSISGVEAAKAAGIKCVALTHTHSAKELKGADIILESMNQLKV